MIEVESASPGDTERFAAALAPRLRPGDVALVSGELGSGKTTFVRGACRALGVIGPVTSPTFTIGHRYHGDVDVAHLDLYRFVSMTDEEWGDLEPYFEDAIVFVEWPQAGAAYLPPARLEIRLVTMEQPDRRLLILESPDGSLDVAIDADSRA
jgi:tRNA threonylcarbamoyladenosine biosynthesis protein TsaE